MRSKALRGNYSKIVSYEKTFLCRGLSANTSVTNLKVIFKILSSKRLTYYFYLLSSNELSGFRIHALR